MDLFRLSAVALSSLLARREASAREIAQSHLDRIAAVDGRIRAFTEVTADAALAAADASDARRSRGDPLGALDGVPVTLKECFDFAGRPTTLGLPSWRGRIAARDAALVTGLREAGAVILGRTNLSQTMLFVEARNPLFGQTANPWSLDHSPGGSSGGEAAAVAAGMSPLGVGTDIGGSIRTPAHFCGVAGLKPTLDRLPMEGYRTVLAGQEAVRGMAGPLARSVGDLALLFQALSPERMSALDPRVPPLPWRDPAVVDVRRLRVGFYVGDGVLRASPALERAVARAAEGLRAMGAAVTPFTPPDVRGLVSTYLAALSADGGATLVAALAGGEVDPVLEPLRRLAALPSTLRRALAAAAGVAGQGGLALMLGAMGEKSVRELWELTATLRAYRARLLRELAAAGIDVLLCPPFATPALSHGASKNFTLASSYSILFNATQLPAGVVPVTRVRADETTGRTAARDGLERQAARVDAASEGLPVGVQVVGRAWREDEVLAVMGAIEGDVGGDPGYPAGPPPREASWGAPLPRR